eukprot:CAMPEP_0116564154 /NCGR_PEP_ID=MMETSP0397-20121206/13146_1 /TAXON_ID=216820 /ORGANISM="Cyclophora tenuis, Strain ECT3854" /LENGTH=117 /DNA_ID=CAMNT_0004090707 /DNA_START=171 /DNA_END=521 /DNA_ORIENTATION=-
MKAFDATLEELMEKFARDKANKAERVEFMFKVESRKERESRRANRKLRVEDFSKRKEWNRTSSAPTGLLTRILKEPNKSNNVYGPRQSTNAGGSSARKMTKKKREDSKQNETKGVVW